MNKKKTMKKKKEENWCIIPNLKKERVRRK